MGNFFRLRALGLAFAASVTALSANPALARTSVADGDGGAASQTDLPPVQVAAAKQTGGQTYRAAPPPRQPDHTLPPPVNPVPVNPVPVNPVPNDRVPVDFGDPAATAPPDTTTSSTSASSSAASGRTSGRSAARSFPVVTLPAAGESRFKQDQVVVAIPKSLSAARIAGILRRHHLTEIDSSPVMLSGVSFHVWSFTDHRTVAKVERELAREAGLEALQPNYIFALTEDLAAASATASTPGLYALDKLRVAASLDLAVAEPIKVAVVDTAIDEAHPDLVGVVAARFDAIGGGKPPNSLDHGTAMAGAIAANGQVRGVAPNVRVLSARAFDTDGSGGALGSSETIIKAIDWALRSGARVINMSFAGPKDPALHETLASAAKRGVVLIAAIGNAGPKSPPLYPGADDNVIAITATDADDHIFAMANVGAYVAVAAPGVDVLLPAPNGGYSLETGTSVSAALASGVVALALERKPRATLQDVRRWLAAGARRPALAIDKALIGAGVIDATATMRAVGGEGVAGR